MKKSIIDSHYCQIQLIYVLPEIELYLKPVQLKTAVQGELKRKIRYKE